MQTGGYDVVAEISEKFINKSLATAYYLGKFPAFNQTYPLPINVPADIRDLAQVTLEVAITNPPVLSVGAAGAAVTFIGQAKFTVLGGVEVGAQAEFKLQVTPTFDTAKHDFCISFGGAQIQNLTLTGFTDFPTATTERLKKVLSAEITKYLTDIGIIELTPSLLAAENALALNIAGLTPATSIYNLAGNVLGRQGGIPNQIGNFCGDSHISLGVTVDAIQRVYDLWWHPPQKVVVANLNKTLDFSLPEWAETAEDWISAAATGFLVSVDQDITGLEFNLKATAIFNKFNLTFKAGNRIEISGSLTLDFDGNVDLLAKTTVSVLLGLGGSKTIHEKIPLFVADTFVPISIVLDSATAEIGIDAQNRLVAKIVDCDVSIPLLIPKVPEFGLLFVKAWIKQKIIDFVGSIVLAPPVIEQPIPGTDLTLQARINSLNSNSQEALVGFKLKTIGVGSYAPYVGNKSKDHMEIHKTSCCWVKKIASKNLVYYIDLEEALDDKFDGCSFCLHDYHTR